MQNTPSPPCTYRIFLSVRQYFMCLHLFFSFKDTLFLINMFVDGVLQSKSPLLLIKVCYYHPKSSSPCPGICYSNVPSVLWHSYRSFYWIFIQIQIQVIGTNTLLIQDHNGSPVREFSVPWIEYPLVGSSKKGSHVYFLLQVFWVILLFCQIVLLFDIKVVLTSQ